MKEIEKQQAEDVAGGNDVLPGGTPPYVPPPGDTPETTFPMPLTQQPQ